MALLRLDAAESVAMVDLTLENCATVAQTARRTADVQVDVLLITRHWAARALFRRQRRQLSPLFTLPTRQTWR